LPSDSAGAKGIITASATKAVLCHIRRSLKPGKASLAENPKEFAKELEAIFGEGALIIERIIIQKLCLKIGFDYKISYFPHIYKFTYRDIFST